MSYESKDQSARARAHKLDLKRIRRRRFRTRYASVA